MMSSDPTQSVNEFLLNLTKMLAAKNMDSVVFAAPYELDGETVYIYYELTVQGVAKRPPEGALH